MKRGIYINSIKSVCSIYESGVMCFNSLNRSEFYTLEYIEGINNQDINSYDFIIFNYHPVVTPWCTTNYLNSITVPKIAIFTEMKENHDFMMNVDINLFNYVIVLDPTQKETETIFSFGRPIEEFSPSFVKNEIPIIGSFGFATPGKRWDLIVKQVVEEFDEAIIRFNIPHATHVPNNQSRINEVLNSCLLEIPENSKIKIEFTHIVMTKQELIKWCSENTINCFFYYRDQHGLSAVTDDAISAQRPILITDCNTFRHMHKYIPYKPNINIKQAILETQDGVIGMYNDWSPINFSKKFENDIFNKIF